MGKKVQNFSSEIRHANPIFLWWPNLDVCDLIPKTSTTIAVGTDRDPTIRTTNHFDTPQNTSHLIS